MFASEIRKMARENLAGKWGKAALIVLVFALVSFALSFLNFIPVLGSIALLVITVPLSYGLISSLMKLKRDDLVRIW